MKMTPAERLIVALDVPNYEAMSIAEDLVRDTDVRFFKLSASNLMEHRRWNIMESIKDLGANIMLDLKIYDTPDSVRRIVDGAFKAGARFITVHPECVIPAQEVLEYMPGGGIKILPILELTSNTGGFTTFDDNEEFKYSLLATGAAVCPPRRLARVRKMFPAPTLVCPGIRHLLGYPDGHAETWGPAAAVRAGADYLVIGRPITEAADPVLIVKRIIYEVERA